MQLEQLGQEQCQREKRMHNDLGGEHNHPGQDSLGEAVVLVARTWFWIRSYFFKKDIDDAQISDRTESL
jgi:hypothetical protein